MIQRTAQTHYDRYSIILQYNNKNHVSDVKSEVFQNLTKKTDNDDTRPGINLLSEEIYWGEIENAGIDILPDGSLEFYVIKHYCKMVKGIAKASDYPDILGPGQEFYVWFGTQQCHSTRPIFWETSSTNEAIVQKWLPNYSDAYMKVEPIGNKKGVKLNNQNAGLQLRGIYAGTAEYPGGWYATWWSREKTTLGFISNNSNNNHLVGLSEFIAYPITRTESKWQMGQWAIWKAQDGQIKIRKITLILILQIITITLNGLALSMFIQKIMTQLLLTWY